MGVRSFTVTFASALVSGLVSQTPVKMPIVCASPFFSTRYAAATAPPPPGLLTTCMRTGSSFSFSSISDDRAREHVAAAAGAGVHDDLDRLASA